MFLNHLQNKNQLINDAHFRKAIMCWQTKLW